MPNSDFVAMEYESQAMINEEQYLRIYQDNLSLNYKHVYSEITNIYYDTPDLFLTNHHMVLRMRRVKDKYNEFTLKTKSNDGVVKEINYPLLDNEEIGGLDQYPLIKEALIEKHIEINKIICITRLLTNRLEVFKEGYLFVIDKNTYGSITDYNLEVESTNMELSHKYLKQEAIKYGVEIKKNYISKSRRAIRSYKNK